MPRSVNTNPVRGVLFNARYSPHVPAVIYEGRELSFAEFAERVTRFATALAAQGVQRGDRVAYVGLNSEMFLRTMLASWWLGAVFEPLNFRLAPREVAALLVRSTPRVLVVEPGHREVVDAARSLGVPRTEAGPTSGEGVTSGESATSGGSGRVPMTPDGSDPAEAGARAAEDALLVLIDDDPAASGAPAGTGAAAEAGATASSGDDGVARNEGEDGEPGEPWRALTAVLAAAEQGAAPVPEIAHVGDEDLAILMFTSGTTGRPKGVRLSHGNLFWNALNVDSVVDTRRRDVNYAVAPLFHIGALNSFTVRALVRGNTTVVRRNFVPSRVLADIESYGVNNAFFVPAMLLAMSQDPAFETARLNSLRALIAAGAPVPPVVISLFEGKGVPVQQAWGLTETSPFATYLPTELTYEKAGSAGMPMLYTEVKIMDPATGDEVTEPDTRGELWVKGPNVTDGYWRDPAATRAAFTDGWFHTGDIGYRDSEGYYYVVDRLKDMIITGGENVYPAEIERVLAEHPAVADAAVVGAADEQWGERIVAVLQAREGAELPDTEAIREFCAARLARYKLPKDVVVVPAVPRNGSGKLDKPAIRQLVSG